MEIILFEGNKAGDDGGAIYAEDSSIIDLNAKSFYLKATRQMMMVVPFLLMRAQ